MTHLPRLSHALLFALGLTFLNACATAEGPYEAVAVQKELTPNADTLKDVKSFAFGSCNKQHLPQPIWKNIIADAPDLFVWTGDVVYADTDDMGKLSQIYASQLKSSEYGQFLQAKIPVIGVWDDHDYGKNAGDESYAPRKTSQSLFLDFVGEKDGSPRRTQDGIQATYAFGQGKSAARFLMLDTHSHRSEKQEDLLGAEQWTWLEAELKKPAEGVTFIVSSIQVLPFEQKFEKWLNFPASHKRLLAAIETSPSKNIVIISGDRHFAELSKQKIGDKDVWEITASGMTHSFRGAEADARNANTLRLGPVMDRLNYGLIKLDGKSVQIQVKDLNRTAVIDQTITLR
ncbi:MAG: alkaline phosphatase family protein [Proteobacteria bacterium]|nr:MAG: alkaline phosphatase family protein [Pseudomonadota bacterium]